MTDKKTSKDAPSRIKRQGVQKGVAKDAPPGLKSWKVAFLLSIFLGFFGADRFYIGRTRSAIVKLLILGGYGVWWLSDIVLIASDWRKDAWGRPLRH